MWPCHRDQQLCIVTARTFLCLPSLILLECCGGANTPVLIEPWKEEFLHGPFLARFFRQSCQIKCHTPGLNCLKRVSRLGRSLNLDGLVNFSKATIFRVRSESVRSWFSPKDSMWFVTTETSHVVQ